MRYLRMVGLSIALVLVLASPLDAQERVRDGFWGGVGGGVGFNLTENSEGERLTGFSAFARAGWALNQKWLVAGDAIGWFYSQDQVDLRRGFLGGSVLFYPSATGGFYSRAASAVPLPTSRPEWPATGRPGDSVRPSASGMTFAWATRSI
jgi:hypothetical protein